MYLSLIVAERATELTMYREALDPSMVWLKVGTTLRIALKPEELQKLVTEGQRELQASIAKAGQS